MRNGYGKLSFQGVSIQHNHSYVVKKIRDRRRWSMFCPKCGYELGNDAERKFCPQCGAEVRNRVKGKNVKKFFLTGIFVFTALNIAVYVKMPKVIVENNEAMLTVYSSREQRTTNVTFPLEGVPSALMAYIKWATIKKLLFQKEQPKLRILDYHIHL